MSEAYLTDYENHLGQLKAHLAGSASRSLPPSFVPPAGYWTSVEKDSFFHALAIHSRLRPDLIADSVKSKTVLDVCAYLDALDSAAAARPTPLLRLTLEAAMEVSDSWIAYEEEQANELAKLEPQWEEEMEQHKRATLLASRFHDEQTYWSWKEEQESLWGKHDALGQLDLPHLSTMNKMIRRGVAEQTTDSVPSGQPTEPPLDHLPISELHDGLIDPALLAQSSTEPSPNRIPSIEPRQPDEGPPNPALPSSPPDNQAPPSEAYFRALTPESRRRLKSRLTMRKRRAEARGTVPNLLPILLPNKPKKPHIPKPEPQIHDECKGGSDVEEEDNDEPAAPSRRQSGLQVEEKIEAIFKGRGIDANTFTEWGLDVFELRKLGKLMGSLDYAYAPGHKSSISIDTIKLLRSILLDFTTAVVRGAISIRDQELILKRNMAIWRLRGGDDTINPGNVADALLMHGFNVRNMFTDDSPTGASYDDEENNEDCSEQRFAEDESTSRMRLPLYRELVSPFVPAPARSEDSCMSPETNMDELLAEVDEELELDKLDCGLEAQYETSLWQAVKDE
ncbi:hypothetical protein DFH08DRAFT_196896 [Mycena albidolilacea]|uniref:Uncharacterized protein n=1 Tax=Mycena albidolilacea TaxID=1033008 RepID=A0AAD6ZZL8_9AGAR|nr:hypothetical protein DFH08DRAFT_196896 [Mycena albidolilacea]